MQIIVKTSFFVGVPEDQREDAEADWLALASPTVRVRIDDDGAWKKRMAEAQETVRNGIFAGFLAGAWGKGTQ